MQREVIIEDILNVLNNGGIIYYAPLSGGIILVDKNGEKSAAQPTTSEFLKLRESGKIDRTDSMRQGHHIFHGQVDFYSKKKNVREVL